MKKTTDPVKKPKRGQQLSDALANKVVKGILTTAEAWSEQRKQDAKVKKITKVGKVTRSSAGNLESKRKYSTAKTKINKKGNLEAY